MKDVSLSSDENSASNPPVKNTPDINDNSPDPATYIQPSKLQWDEDSELGEIKSPSCNRRNILGDGDGTRGNQESPIGTRIRR